MVPDKAQRVRRYEYGVRVANSIVFTQSNRGLPFVAYSSSHYRWSPSSKRRATRVPHIHAFSDSILLRNRAPRPSSQPNHLNTSFFLSDNDQTASHPHPNATSASALQFLFLRNREPRPPNRPNHLNPSFKKRQRDQTAPHPHAASAFALQLLFLRNRA
nr:hypothetical protein Iba_chr02cCG16810 [Ipomoea batatas]